MDDMLLSEPLAPNLVSICRTLESPERISSPLMGELDRILTIKSPSNLSEPVPLKTAVGEKFRKLSPFTVALPVMLSGVLVVQEGGISRTPPARFNGRGFAVLLSVYFRRPD